MKKIILSVGIVALLAVLWYLNQTPDNQAADQIYSDNQIQSSTKEFTVNYSKDNSFQSHVYQAAEGDDVILRVTSDVADEVHLHGYDLSVDLEPNEEGRIDFKADKTGRFEFELEDSGITLGVIEVYPKE